MRTARILSGLISFLLMAIAAATPHKAASTQEQPPVASAPPDAPVYRRGGKMDVTHPLHVGSNYYPKQSLKNGEQGVCTLAFFIEADGTVPAAQLLISTGFPRLDTACFESVIGLPLIAATINGTLIAGWYDFNLAWVIDHAQPYHPPQKLGFPRIADDYEFPVGRQFYPESAPLQNPKGYCVVHTTVGSTGTALNASISHSTGSATLDKACLAAVTAARFTPELQNGAPVADSTDIAIYW